MRRTCLLSRMLIAVLQWTTRQNMTISLEFQRSGPKDNSAKMQSICTNCAGRLSAYTAEDIKKKELDHVCKNRRRHLVQQSSPSFTTKPFAAGTSSSGASRKPSDPELKLRVASSNSAEGVCSACGAYFHVVRPSAQHDHAVLMSRLREDFEQHARMLHGTR